MSKQSFHYLPECSARLEGLTVELQHPNGERRTFELEAIASSYVSIRWGMSGVYDLNLKVNVLTARSKGAQRRGSCPWTAVDIETVRRMVKTYTEREAAEQKAALLRHTVSMPHATYHPALVSGAANDAEDEKKVKPWER